MRETVKSRPLRDYFHHNDEVDPVNAFEAESRRLARFSTLGHTPGLLHVPPATINVVGSKEFPFTRDMRRG